MTVSAVTRNRSSSKRFPRGSRPQAKDGIQRGVNPAPPKIWLPTPATQPVQRRVPMAVFTWSPRNDPSFKRPEEVISPSSRIRTVP
jgi:hypothetical protein